MLHSVCDNNPKIIEDNKEKFPEVNYTDSFEAILKVRFSLRKKDEMKDLAASLPVILRKK